MIQEDRPSTQASYRFQKNSKANPPAVAYKQTIENKLERAGRIKSLPASQSARKIEVFKSEPGYRGVVYLNHKDKS